MYAEQERRARVGALERSLGIFGRGAIYASVESPTYVAVGGTIQANADARVFAQLARDGGRAAYARPPLKTHPFCFGRDVFRSPQSVNRSVFLEDEKELIEELREETSIYLAKQEAKELSSLALNGGFFAYMRPGVKAHPFCFGRDIFCTPQSVVRTVVLNEEEKALEEELRAETAIYLANQDAKVLSSLARDGGRAAYARPPLKAHPFCFGRDVFRSYHFMVRCEAVPIDPRLFPVANLKRVRTVSSDEGDNSDEGKAKPPPTNMDSPGSIAFFPEFGVPEPLSI